MARKHKDPPKDRPKRKSANGRSPPRTKLTAEAISDAKRKDLFFHYLKKVTPLWAAEKLAKQRVKEVTDMAGKEGVSLKELKLAVELKKDDGDKKIGAEIERIGRISQWVGVDLSEQLEMFGIEAPDPIFADGKNAAGRGEACKPPAHHGQKAGQRWIEGWHAGNDARNAAIQDGMGGLGAAANKVMEDAAAAAGMQAPETPAAHPH